MSTKPEKNNFSEFDKPREEKLLEHQLKQQLLDAIVKVMWALLVLAAWPILVIWAINTLFSVAIPLTFWTWLSVVILRTAVISFPSTPKEKLVCIPTSQTKN